MFWLFIAFIAPFLIYWLYIISADNKPSKESDHQDRFKEKGSEGELLIQTLLKQIPGRNLFVFNAYVPCSTPGLTKTEVDLIMINSTGIYVFESKNYGGWIFGSEDHGQWTQSLYSYIQKTTIKYHFYNPIMQNQTHIKYLKQFLHDESIPFYSFIVFGRGAQLKNVTLTSNEHYVCELGQMNKIVLDCIKNHEKVLSENKIDELYHKIYPLCRVSKEDKEQHIREIHELYQL